MGNQCIGGSSSASRSSRRAASHHAPAESSARTGRGSSSQPSGGGALGGLRRRSAQPQQTAAQLQRAYDEVTDLLNRTASNPAFRTQQQQLHSLQGGNRNSPAAGRTGRWARHTAERIEAATARHPALHGTRGGLSNAPAGRIGAAVLERHLDTRRHPERRWKRQRCFRPHEPDIPVQRLALTPLHRTGVMALFARAARPAGAL